MSSLPFKGASALAPEHLKSARGLGYGIDRTKRAASMAKTLRYCTRDKRVAEGKSSSESSSELRKLTEDGEWNNAGKAHCVPNERTVSTYTTGTAGRFGCTPQRAA
jgi:hypothetical protein